LALEAAAPHGWFLAGDKPKEYDCDVDDRAVFNGQPSAYLKAKVAEVNGFGTMMQDFEAEQFTGKRVRFSGFVRSEGVKDWAGLWMRVDKGAKMGIAFDNMQNRPIKGTTNWQSYQVVLDVPKDATKIAFGILLAGSGSVWLNSAKFEVVGEDVPTTEKPRPKGPTNLDFEKQ
jgi:hypothetical protein